MCGFRRWGANGWCGDLNERGIVVRLLTEGWARAPTPDR